LSSMRKVIGILIVSYLVFGGIVAWLVWDSLKQNGFTGNALYIRFFEIIVIFILLSFLEFWMKYKIGLKKTLLFRSIAVGIGVGIISFIMGYSTSNAAMWAFVFGVIYYFWDRSKMIKLSKINK